MCRVGIACNRFGWSLSLPVHWLWRLCLPRAWSSGERRLSDLLDIQGDRIVGRETIPILIGVKNTRKLLLALLIFHGIVACGVISAWDGSHCGLLAVINTLMFGCFFVVYRKRHLVDRVSVRGDCGR